MKASVLITHLNDPRVERSIRSALGQGAWASEVLLADGGSDESLLGALDRTFGTDPRFRILRLPGSVAATRNAALARLRSPFVAFLDADEVAPVGWLERLGGPLRDGTAEFTGGPTRPLGAARSRAESYVNREDERLYQQGVSRDAALLPMGNSAWSVDLLRRVGGFDERLAWGGEDYDVNLRALATGARAQFVPEAWVWHDQSHLDSFRKVLRRKYRYYFGAATAYLKNGQLGPRTRASARRFRIGHAVDLADVVLKPLALVRARQYYRRVYGSSPA